MNKPAGLLTARRDDFGRRTVMELLPPEWATAIYPVGRLDKDTTGFLLFTNDGDLAYRCMHPSHHVSKTYLATVLGLPDEASLRRLRHGVDLEDGMTYPAEVWLRHRRREEAQVEITIHEGRNRQVRRMFKHIGHPVRQLERIGFGPLRLGDLGRGEWRPLDPDEIRSLRAACDLPWESSRD
jgi:23S rRNA pseudouridine2605 synthase